MVFDKDEEWDEEETEDDDGCPEGYEMEAEEGKGGCSQNGGEGDVAGEDEDHKEDCEGAACGGRREGEKDSKCTGDAFAAAKAQPDGEDMAQDGGDGGGDGQIVVAGSEVLGDSDGEIGFSQVEEKGGDAEAVGSRAGYVGGADVAAAGGTDVLFEEDFDKEIAEGDGAQEVG